jgi:putative FmdB family regulatory protein
MPIYEFACGPCGEVFEELVPISAAAAPACPTCGSARTERRLSTFQRVRVKGGTPSFAAMPGGHGGCCGGACSH